MIRKFITLFLVILLLGGCTTDYYLTKCSDIDGTRKNEEKLDCYTKLGKSKEDLSVCDKIEEKYYRDSCYLGVALETENGSICHLIMYSKDYCGMTLAEKTGDPSLCSLVPSGPLKQKFFCYLSAFGKESINVARQDPSVCHGIPEEDMSRKNSCYHSIAVYRKNYSICDMIKPFSSEYYEKYDVDYNETYEYQIKSKAICYESVSNYINQSSSFGT